MQVCHGLGRGANFIMWLHLGSSVTVIEGPAITVNIGLSIYIRAPVGGQYGFKLEVARGRAVDMFVEYSFINPLCLGRSC